MFKFSKKFKENLVPYAIYLTLAFILFSTTLSFWNRYVTYDTRRIIDQTERTKNLTRAVNDNIIRQIDLGIQAFALTHDEKLLQPYHSALSQKDSVLNALETELSIQNFSMETFNQTKKSVENYVVYAKNLVATIKMQDTTAMMEMFKEIQGFPAKQQYQEFSAKVFAFENEIEAQARSDYEWSIADNAIIQIILIILSVPILLIASQRLRNEVKNRNKLLKELDDNNRKYLYNDGSPQITEAEAVVEKSIGSFRLAFDFVENVSQGKYETARTSIAEEVKILNKNTLMGALLGMSEQLKKAEEEEEKRHWISENLNRFSEIVRNEQADFTKLSDKVTAFLTKSLKSQQGSLFILRNENDTNFLELATCYAFDKKKWLEKRIEIGYGLVGQTYLEGKPTLLTKVPQGYTHITSGLGEATPSHLLIIPMQYNEKVEALFEVTGFQKYEAHHVEFLEKAGEFLASALQTLKNNEQMTKLLTQSTEQAEILKAQEEELRQNIEELEATNEAIRRKESEME